ncbi:MAG: cytochrome c oxidase subunit 3 [Dehalococcoidia bacterium]
MAAAESAHIAHHVDPHSPERVRINRLGLWLFLASDALLFALFAAARFYTNGTYRPEDLKQVLGLGVTIILLVSSLTAFRAETSFQHGNVSHGRLMLLLTILLGLGFVGGVITEWNLAEFVPSEGFGTSYFSMTGMHSFHVITGIVFLIVIYVRSGRGHFSSGYTWPVSAVIIYWHFVDVVWVFFYPTLYLVK